MQTISIVSKNEMRILIGLRIRYCPQNQVSSLGDRAHHGWDKEEEATENILLRVHENTLYEYRLWEYIIRMPYPLLQPKRAEETAEADSIDL